MGQQKVKEFNAEKGAIAEKAGQAKKAHKSKQKEFLPQLAKKNLGEDVRYIVRVANKDLDGTLPAHRALASIKGISTRTAVAIANALEATTGFSQRTPLGKISKEQEQVLGEIVGEPAKFKIPTWMCNRRKDIETGADMHLIMADLDFTKRKDFNRMSEMKSYRGLRHIWGLTVRGQKTRSTHRGKGGAIGVMKKEARQGK